MASPRRSIRMLVLLLATVLAVPLTALLGVAPAHAAAFAATGTVSDGLGDPLAGVTVTARSAPAYTVTASSTTTDTEGGYSLSLTAGSYRLEYSRTGYQSAFYGGTPALDVVARFPLGMQLRILPNHACATGAQFPEYHALAEDGTVQTWSRFHGW